MGNGGIYAEPREVAGLADCYFYHTVDIPGHGVIHGSWDLRDNLDAYLGFVDFQNKRVFDAGTGNGLLAFAAEQRGAREIVAFDLAQTEEWDHVPYPDSLLLQVQKHTRQEAIDERRQMLAKLNNAFWFCHQAFRSKVKMCYGNIYSIPAAIGPVDIAIFGAILLHLKSPLNALEQAAKITAETIIVTNLVWRNINNDLPMSLLLPSPQPPLSIDAWWVHSPALISQFLQVLGYTDTTVSYHTQLRDEHNRRPTQFYTVVGRKR